MTGRLCLYYSLGMFLLQLGVLSMLSIFNVSPTRSKDVMLFLKIFIPTVLFSSYILLRFLHYMDESRKKRDEISEFLMIVFSLAAFLIGTVFFHVMTILFGASLLDTVEETFAFSCLCSSLTAFPLCVAYEAKWEDFVFFLYEPMDVKNSLKDAVKMMACISVFGAWCGAFPIPLDWDRDWQTWPITCCIGCISGQLISSLLVLLVAVGFVKVRSEFDEWKHKVT